MDFLDAPILEELNLVLQTAMLLATIIAIPWVSWAFLQDLAERRRERARQIYHMVDHSFRENLALALAHPRLDWGDFEYTDGSPQLSDDERIQQWFLYDIFTSSFEICYLTFLDNQDDPKFRDQWKAWREYMVRCLRKQSYGDWLHFIGLVDRSASPYDPRFCDELRRIYSESALGRAPVGMSLGEPKSPRSSH